LKALVIAAAVLGPSLLSAHDVVVEQVVEMTLAPRGERLRVTLHLPATLTGDPDLPGLLRNGDEAGIQNHLRIVAVDIAHNLDVQQDDLTLPDPAITVRRAEDRASIDVELRYAVRGGAAGISARLNAFSAKDGTLRTRARYQPLSGREQIVSVSGPAARVAFDPQAATVVAEFAVRGLRALFGGDQLLFLVCILLPVRRGRSAAALFAAAALAQAAVIAVSTVRPAMTADWLSAVTMVAASAIVIAAIQNVAGARLRWVVPVAAAFGVLNGWTLGTAAAAAAQFAGTHQPIALLAFSGVVLAGELWLGGLVWALRAWLHERGLPERVLCVLGSAIVAHDALHRVVERSQWLARDGSFAGEHALVWLTLAWIVATLFAGRGQCVLRRHGRGTGRMSTRMVDTHRWIGSGPAGTDGGLRGRRPDRHGRGGVSRNQRDHQRRRQGPRPAALSEPRGGAARVRPAAVPRAAREPCRGGVRAGADIAMARGWIAGATRRGLPLDTLRTWRGDRLSGHPSRPCWRRLAPRDPGAGTRHGAGPRAQRRRAPSPA